MKSPILFILLVCSCLNLTAQAKLILTNDQQIPFLVEIYGKDHVAGTETLLLKQQFDGKKFELTIPSFAGFYSIKINNRKCFLEPGRTYEVLILSKNDFKFRETQPGINQTLEEVDQVFLKHDAFAEGDREFTVTILHTGRSKNSNKKYFRNVQSTLKEIDLKFKNSPYQQEIDFYILPFRLADSFRNDNEAAYFDKIQKYLLNVSYRSVFYNDAFNFLIGFSLRQFYDLNEDISNEAATQESVMAFEKASSLLNTIQNDSLASVSYLVMLHNYYTSFQTDVSRIKPDPFQRVKTIEKSKNASTVRNYAALIGEIIRTLATGTMAPDFRLVDFNGDSVSLQSLRGKYVYLDFWFSRCPPCIGSMRKLKTTYQNYGENIVFVSINSFDTFETAKEIVDKEGFIGLQLFAGRNHPIVKDYNIAYYPTYFLISTSGEILYKPVDYHEAEFEKVMSCLSENKKAD